MQTIRKKHVRFFFGSFYGRRTNELIFCYYHQPLTVNLNFHFCVENIICSFSCLLRYLIFSCSVQITCRLELETWMIFMMSRRACFRYWYRFIEKKKKIIWFTFVLSISVNRWNQIHHHDDPVYNIWITGVSKKKKIFSFLLAYNVPFQ